MAPGDKRRQPVLHIDVETSGTRLRARGLAAWLAAVAPASARGEVTVALVSDARVRALNKHYRRKDYPTDVLSFPAEGLTRNLKRETRNAHRTQPTRDPHFATNDNYLGDIVIAAGVAARQAREAGHPVATELRLLALHGLLHLLGYDHENAVDRGRMARIEKRLRVQGGLREGLIERATK